MCGPCSVRLREYRPCDVRLIRVRTLRCATEACTDLVSIVDFFPAAKYDVNLLVNLPKLSLNLRTQSSVLVALILGTQGGFHRATAP